MFHPVSSFRDMKSTRFLFVLMLTLAALTLQAQSLTLRHLPSGQTFTLSAGSRIKFCYVISPGMAEEKPEKVFRRRAAEDPQMTDSLYFWHYSGKIIALNDSIITLKGGEEIRISALHTIQPVGTFKNIINKTLIYGMGPLMAGSGLVTLFGDGESQRRQVLMGLSLMAGGALVSNLGEQWQTVVPARHRGQWIIVKP